jgi:hypothetical protein
MCPFFVEERYMEDLAAMSAADPTESYAPGKSHEISRCAPCPASDPGRMLRNVTLEPRNTRRRRSLSAAREASLVESC